jgi:hypothetical protein
MVPNITRQLYIPCNTILLNYNYTLIIIIIIFYGILVIYSHCVTFP